MQAGPVGHQGAWSPTRRGGAHGARSHRQAVRALPFRPCALLQSRFVYNGTLRDSHGYQNARFGACIAAVRDLNQDSYNDVVVGAPLEDGHQGAIYVFRGAPGGILKTPSQVRLGQRGRGLGAAGAPCSSPPPPSAKGEAARGIVQCSPGALSRPPSSSLCPPQGRSQALTPSPLPALPWHLCLSSIICTLRPQNHAVSGLSPSGSSFCHIFYDTRTKL